MNGVLASTRQALVAALSPRGGERLLLACVVTSLPATLIAAWLVGGGHDVDPRDWRAEWQALAAGGAALLPSLAVALATAFAWERLFALGGGRRGDAGWFMAAWFCVLLLPPATPLPMLVAGLSFGMVFGLLVFGGTGRYLASPALLAALFVEFAWPGAAGERAAFAALGAFSAHSPHYADWAFVLACAAGAFTLVALGVASARTLVAVPLALLLVSPLAPADAGLHLAAGGFAFGWAFILTDPTTQALTRAGRWLHGASFAGLVVLLRSADPAGPDGVLTALLLAGLLVPAFDALALAVLRRRRGETLELLP